MIVKDVSMSDINLNNKKKVALILNKTNKNATIKINKNKQTNNQETTQGLTLESIESTETPWVGINQEDVLRQIGQNSVRSTGSGSTKVAGKETPTNFKFNANTIKNAELQTVNINTNINANVNAIENSNHSLQIISENAIDKRDDQKIKLKKNEKSNNEIRTETQHSVLLLVPYRLKCFGSIWAFALVAFGFGVITYVSLYLSYAQSFCANISLNGKQYPALYLWDSCVSKRSVCVRYVCVCVCVCVEFRLHSTNFVNKSKQKKYLKKKN